MTRKSGQRGTVAGFEDGRKGPLKSGKRKEKNPSLEPPGRHAARCHLDLRTSDLQNYMGINSCCHTPRSLW